MFDMVLNTFLINLFKVNDQNNSGVVSLKQLMSKLLTFAQIFAGKWVAKWEGGCKLLHYVLDMLNISPDGITL